MNPRLAIKPPSPKQAPVQAQPPAVGLADLRPDLDRALSLALAARAAAEAGDHDRAAALRFDHDAIFAELEKRLPKT